MIDFTNDGMIIDKRVINDKILNGGKMSICYTLNDDDITKGKKPSCTPYQDREDELVFKNGIFYGKETCTQLKCYPFENGIIIELLSKNENLSEYGINLPFNFMGKLDGGGYKNQFLFNSPYVSEENEIKYFYLTKPNGNNLLVTILTDANGWKMDYSPHSWGHYFINLKLLANFDRAYNQPRNDNHLKVGIFPVTTFENCLETLSRVYSLPFLGYETSGGETGASIKLKPYGDIDYLIEKYDGKEKQIPYSQNYKIKCEGQTTLIPVKNDKKGAPVSIYGYKSLTCLYKKSIDTIDIPLIEARTNSNLCEHQSWVSAMLRFLIKYKSILTPCEVEIYEKKLKSQLDIITEKDEEKALPERTIFDKPHDRYMPYNVYKSCRVQELAGGITILLDAYKYFKDEEYLKYAKGATTCLISYYQKEDGRIEVDWGEGSKEDYTTVCAPIIPIIDMANYLKDSEPVISLKFKESAEKIASYLYKRGLVFPTEGAKTDLTEKEMEDGSISCTALSLLYYCKNVERNGSYIEKAKEILDLHENWVIKAPLVGMHGSTLRWWETGWEGDADGPAICAGHAWTIWRAEADYLYYELTGDKSYLIKSQNGFMTNLSKIDKDGYSYAIYNPDMINGGGFHCDCDKINYKIATKYPSYKDSGMSRYVWIRINDTFLQ